MKSVRTDKDGLFIVVDGIDGVGKTTLCKEIVEKLKESGIKVKYYKEKEQFNGYQYIAERQRNEMMIKNGLFDGYGVICDRYGGSTFAYNTEVSLNSFIIQGENGLKPDYEFIIDLELTKINKVMVSRGEDTIDSTRYTTLQQRFGMYAGLCNIGKCRVFTYDRNTIYKRVGKILGDGLGK